MKEKIVNKDFDWVNTPNDIPEQIAELTVDELIGILKKFQKKEDCILKISIKCNKPKV
jgi:hypothetical protein